MTSERPRMSVLSFFDVALVVIATPIMLLLGASAAGYCLAAGAWVLLRAAGVGVERFAAATPDANRQIAARMGLMFVRLFGLALVVILVRKSDGQDAAITALVVVVVAFTVQLLTAPFGRPRRGSRPPSINQRPR